MGGLTWILTRITKSTDHPSMAFSSRREGLGVRSWHAQGSKGPQQQPPCSVDAILYIMYFKIAHMYVYVHSISSIYKYIYILYIYVYVDKYIYIYILAYYMVLAAGLAEGRPKEKNPTSKQGPNLTTSGT